MTTNNITKHACTLCSSIFPSNSKLLRHTESHSIIPSYFCDFCERAFRRDENVVEHWRNACYAIRFFLSDEERKSLPTKDIKEIVFRFILQLRKEDIKELLDDESQPISSLLIGSICQFCNVLVPFNALSRHYEVHTNRCLPGEAIIAGNNTESYSCDLCGLGFRMKKFLFQHWRESCSEILAQIPLDGRSMSNEQLQFFVANLVHKSNMKNPEKISVTPLQKKKCSSISSEESPAKRACLSEYADDFKYKIVPPLSIDRGKWLCNKQLAASCDKCERKFANQGRLERHETIFHSDWRVVDNCELCLAGFKRKSALLMHLRRNCGAMKIEIADVKERLATPIEDLLKVVKNTKGMWNSVFEKQREICYNRMKDYIDKIDIQRKNEKIGLKRKTIKITAKKVEYPKLLLSSQSISPSPSSSPETRVQQQKQSPANNPNYKCPICNAGFQTVEIIKRHIFLTHKMNAESIDFSLNRSTENAGPPTPIYYDSDGTSYFIGDYLEHSPLKTGFLPDDLQSGIKIRKIDVGDNCVFFYVILKIHGNPNRYVVVKDSQLDLLSEKNGNIKKLFVNKPIPTEIPVLEKQV